MRNIVTNDESQPTTTTTAPGKHRGISIVPEPARDHLRAVELEDYAEHRVELIDWLLDVGKNPSRDEGYMESTANARACRIDQFYRWVWDRRGSYTTRVKPDHADAYVEELARDNDVGQDGEANIQKALKALFRWRSAQFGGEEWEPNEEYHVNNYTASKNDQPAFTKKERELLRDEVLSFRSVPSYNSLDPEERDRFKTYLAQRLEKPKDDVGPADFEGTPSRKYSSLIRYTLDLGLRPCEVGDLRVDWFDPVNERIVIPEEYSRKNDQRWECYLLPETCATLSGWTEEREAIPKYDDSDRMWLTKYGNPYCSESLNGLLTRLCDHSGIRKGERTWTSIRRSVGTIISSIETVEHAREQLRHSDARTTQRYVQPGAESIQEALRQGG